MLDFTSVHHETSLDPTRSSQHFLAPLYSTAKEKTKPKLLLSASQHQTALRTSLSLALMHILHPYIKFNTMGAKKSMKTHRHDLTFNCRCKTHVSHNDTIDVNHQNRIRGLDAPSVGKGKKIKNDRWDLLNGGWK